MIREISKDNSNEKELLYNICLKVLDDIEKQLKSECDICNHDLEYLCKIHNRHNQKTLKIGRDCNKHFRIFNDEDLGKAIEKRKYLSRLEKLDAAHPYIQERLVGWDEFIKKEKMYLFLNVRQKYYDIRDEIADLYDEYIKSKNITIEREDEIINLIGKLLNTADIEKKKIINYIEKNKDNILIPTKNMVIGLRNNDWAGTGIKWLEEDAVIRARTLHRFTDEEFSNKLIPTFNEILEHKKVKIHRWVYYKQ